MESVPLDVFCLTEAVYAEIVAHAREGKPEEVCGILRGRGGTAQQLVRARNVAADRVIDYVVDPQTLLRQFEFEEHGDEMVAIYHSHPRSPAYPSASDAWNAYYPECVYLICSLQDDHAPDVRAFRLTPHDIAIDVKALCAGLSFDETRPRRFAYYQAAQARTRVLQPVSGQVPAPFLSCQAPLEGRSDSARASSLLNSRCGSRN
jgi:proteasome lid subunit RPN8/RPN11